MTGRRREVLGLRPIILEPNLLRRPYFGGSTLGAFRGMAATDEDHLPEDWIASTTTVFRESVRGLSHLADGRSLRSIIEMAPEAFLGPEHSASFAADPRLLVKLIDAGQRLALHAHPDRVFAHRYLGSCYGKTEAWYVLGVRGHEPRVYLGFREEISLRALTAAVESSQGADLLDRVNPVAVEPGDAIFVPAGIPHAIGEGVFLTEVQEPSDLIVRLEWTDYVIGSLPSDLGLGFAVALHAVNRSAVDADRLATLIRRHGDAPRLDVAVDLLPQAAAPFFRVERVAPARVVRLDPGFSIIIVVDGSGELRTGTVRTILRRGTTALVPWASGAAILTGNVEIIRCRPPDCAVARSVDPGPIP